MASFRTHVARLKYEALLLLAAAIWGMATVVIKGTVDAFPPSWLVCIRFTLAGIICCFLFASRIAKLKREGRLLEHIRVASVLGVAMIFGYLFNTNGLTGTTAAKSSFLTGTYCIWVPFLVWAVMKRKPTIYNMVAAVLCLFGIGLVSLSAEEAFSISWGDAVTLGSAVFIGVQVVVTFMLGAGRDMRVLTAFQFLLGGLIAFPVALLSGPAPTADILFAADNVLSLIYLVVFATCSAMLLQNFGLAKVPPASGALLLSFESVFGVSFSVIFLGEVLSGAMVVGFCLIFCAVVVSEWLPSTELAKRLPFASSR